jgi:hypothetical protein
MHYSCMYACMLHVCMVVCMILCLVVCVYQSSISFCHRHASDAVALVNTFTPGYILTCIATTAIGAFLIGAAAKLMITHKWGWNLAMVSECC